MNVFICEKNKKGQRFVPVTEDASIMHMILGIETFADITYRSNSCSEGQTMNTG